jgi:hypothetical protein
MVNKILKETHILWYRAAMLNLFIRLKIFSDVGFLSFFTKLSMLINSSHRGAPSMLASESTVKAN